MPELPEVETTLRYLSGVLLNKKIQKVEVLFPKIIRKVEVKLFEAALQNQKINEIFRRGKYLFFVLDD
jgi:formamidopyrimidine-DNA glycosylase